MTNAMRAEFQRFLPGRTENLVIVASRTAGRDGFLLFSTIYNVVFLHLKTPKRASGFCNLTLWFKSVCLPDKLLLGHQRAKSEKAFSADFFVP